MNHSLSFFAFFLACKLSLSAQLAPELQNLEGVWYQAGRASVCYSVWQYPGGQTLENRTFSIVCGDTVEISRATVAVRGEHILMTLRADSTAGGAAQIFRLTRYNDEALLWENENPEGVPLQLEWLFTGNSYCTFRADGWETDYRRKRAPMKLRFRVSAGANLSTFSNNSAPNHFLALQNVGLESASYQRLPGQELAFSTGLLFPETPLCLNLELGLTRRQVGVHARFVGEQIGYSRDGVYDYINTYFALVPEVFVGENRDLSLSAGFYFDLAQQRGFRGTNFSAVSNAAHADPRQDIDVERGWLVGASYRLPILERFQPALYVRNTFGLNSTKLRAVSLGVSVQLGEK